MANQGGRPPSGGQGGKGGPPMHGDRGGDDQDGGDEALNLMQANKLKENRFCQNGCFELDRYQFNNGSTKIRSECEEGATTADREAFPNS